MRQASALLLRQGLRSLSLSSSRTILARSSLSLPQAVPRLSSARHYASLTPTPSPSTSPPTPSAPDLADSLNRIVPDDIFTDVPAQIGAREQAALPRETARKIVSIVLLQLRAASDTKTHEEALRAQEEADRLVNQELVQSSRSLADLHAFATLLIRRSTDPRRQPIAFRLFAIAHGVDPMTTPDPTTTPSSPPSSTSSSGGEEGERPTLAAPGYSWASMVLQGAAPPPLGFHLLPPDSKARADLRTAQQAAAVRMYATLAMRGDAMGLLGMGRVLLGGINAQKKNGESVKEKKEVREKVRGMWTRAAQAGVGEAWFELGVLELNEAPGHIRDTHAAQRFFEHGANANNARSHHALGVLLSQQASPPSSSSTQEPSVSNEKKQDLLARSLHHFTAAAKLGDAQSAHNVGLRYLLREELVGEVANALGREAKAEVIREEAERRHLDSWGVGADDAQARAWFQKASDLGSLPASLNLAGMLVEDRGTPSPPPSSSSAAPDHLSQRLLDLQAAEKLYMRVVGLASVNEATQPEARQMAAFARETAGSVKEMISELLQTREEVRKAQEVEEK